MRTRLKVSIASGIVACLLLATVTLMISNRYKTNQLCSASRALALSNKLNRDGRFPDVMVTFTCGSSLDGIWDLLTATDRSYPSTIRGRVSSKEELKILTDLVSDHSILHFPVQIEIEVDELVIDVENTPTR